MSVKSSTQAATVTAPATSTTSATVVPAAGAQARIITNNSAAILYLRFGSGAASATDFSVQIAAGATWTMPDSAYGGQITGILASGAGTALVTSY